MILRSNHSLYCTVISASSTYTVDTYVAFQALNSGSDPDTQLTQITTSAVTPILTNAPTGKTLAVPEFTVKNHNSSVGTVTALVTIYNTSTAAHYGLYQAPLAPGDSYTYQKGVGITLNCQALMGTNLNTIITNALPPGLSMTDVMKQLSDRFGFDLVI